MREFGIEETRELNALVEGPQGLVRSRTLQQVSRESPTQIGSDAYSLVLIDGESRRRKLTFSSSGITSARR